MSTDATMATEMLAPALRALATLGPEVERRAVESGLAILAEDGLHIDSFEALDRRVPHRTGLRLLENAVRVSGNPAFALVAGDGVERGDLGLFDFLTHSAPSLGEAMRVGARYLPLLHDGAEIEVVDQGDQVAWQHRLRAELPDSPGAHEYVVAAHFRGARQLMGFDAPALEVHVIHDPVPYRDAYDAVFLGAPVRFGRERNAIVMPRGAVDVSSVAADAPLHETLRRYGDQSLARIAPLQPFAEQVRALVWSRLDRGLTMEDAAGQLNLSESTCRRRLLAEGVSFRDLVDGVRRERSVELLAQTDLHVGEVATRLGFAHTPAFHRAFQRWFGLSPTEHRARNRRSAFYRFYSRGGRTR